MTRPRPPINIEFVGGPWDGRRWHNRATPNPNPCGRFQDPDGNWWTYYYQPIGRRTTSLNIPNDEANYLLQRLEEKLPPVDGPPFEPTTYLVYELVLAVPCDHPSTQHPSGETGQ